MKDIVDKRIGGLILSLLGLVVGNTLTQGSTITWTNTSGGNWSVAANWNPNQVPGAIDMAAITNSRSFKILDI